MQNINDYWNSLKMFNEFDINACAFGRVTAQGNRDWSFKHFTASFNKLYFMESGSLTVEQTDSAGNIIKTYELTAGNVYLIPCGNVYNLYTDPGFSKHFLHINVMMKDGYDLFYGVGDILSAPYPTDVFLPLCDRLDENDYFSVVKAKSIAYDALITIIENGNSDLLSQRFHTVSKYPPELINAIKHIRTSLSAKLTVENVASECGMSSQVLAKLFSKYMNITPKKYMETQLWELSSRLLLTSDMSIKEITAELEFSDQYSFSKFFKRHCTHSPSQYRMFRLDENNHHTQC